jgi:BASS family bile acid:Na+ symporter
MSPLVEVGLPLIIVYAMAVVGLELTPADLRRVLQYPAHVAVALVGQMLLLPLFGLALILALRPEPAITGGLILVAAAPQAIISNYYCLLGRANIALSLTLTAVSSVLALVSTPIVAQLAFRLLLEQRAGFALPAGAVMEQVLSGLLLPIAAGMLVRHHAPGFVERYRVRFQQLSLLALATLITVVLVGEAGTIVRNLLPIVLGGLLFTAGALALGLAIAKVFSWNRIDTITMAAAYPSRSLSIATLIAVNVLGRPDFLSFAVVFFLVQAVVLVPAMVLARPAGAGA